MSTRFYRVRRRADGLYLGARKWGETHSTEGKFYAKAGHATSAAKGAGVRASEHELIEYEIKEVAVRPLEGK
jgi:hypothetical protein